MWIVRERSILEKAVGIHDAGIGGLQGEQKQSIAWGGQSKGHRMQTGTQFFSPLFILGALWVFFRFTYFVFIFLCVSTEIILLPTNKSKLISFVKEKG